MSDSHASGSASGSSVMSEGTGVGPAGDDPERQHDDELRPDQVGAGGSGAAGEADEVDESRAASAGADAADADAADADAADADAEAADTADPDAAEIDAAEIDAAEIDAAEIDADAAVSDEDQDEEEAGAEGDEDDAEEDEESGTEDGGGTGGRRAGRARGGAESLRRLEEEGEVAADYLEELLDIADLDGDIDIDVENGRASVAILAEGSADRELRRLVGPRGEVLEALQELSRLAVQARTGDRSRLMLDVAGFRAARRRTLEDVAARACQEVRRAGAAVRLEPMTAFERKVVHDVVAEAGLVSESEGEEPQRRVVVFPAS